MATRTFCDHCGNTIRNPKVLSFGDLKGVLSRNEAQHRAVMQQVQALHANVQYIPPQAGPVSAKQSGVPEIGVTHVDLCPTCVPIWLERVKALCKASDPDV